MTNRRGAGAVGPVLACCFALFAPSAALAQASLDAGGPGHADDAPVTAPAPVVPALPPSAAASARGDRGDAIPLRWPAARAYRHKRRIEEHRDPSTGAVTTQMTVEKGKYLLWMQRPRVTVTVVRPAELPAGRWPELVRIEFRTQSPQYTATNVLSLSVGDSLRLEAPAVASRSEHRTQVTDHTLTFALPLADFLSAVHGEALRLEVGGVAVQLRREQLDALRALMLHVRAAGAGADTGSH